jgi:hypothetical protein
MATEEEKKKMVQDMLAKLRESNAYTIGEDPTLFPAHYGLDELVDDDRFPDMLGVAIVNHLRRLAGEIQPTKARKTDPRGAVEEMAADGLDWIFSTIQGDEKKAENISKWMFSYLFALFAYRSKVISDALKTAAAARDPAK